LNQFDLIEYLKKGSSRYIDYLETPLKIRLTFFGDHFANNNEKESIIITEPAKVLISKHKIDPVLINSFIGFKSNYG
jgi:hypothetical protein